VAFKANVWESRLILSAQSGGSVIDRLSMPSRLAQSALGEEGLRAYGSMTALQHMGDPAEVGAAAAFLASSDSSFMTASEVAVDGGLAQL